MIVSLMVPCEEEAWKAILPLVEETGADGIELNFGAARTACRNAHGKRGWGRPNTRDGHPLVQTEHPDARDRRS